MAQQMSLYFQPSRHFCNLEASYPANNRHLRYVKWKLQSSSSFAWPLLSHVLGRCRRVVSTFTKFRPLPSLSRKSGRVSKAVLYDGGGGGGRTQALDLQIPLARQSRIKQAALLCGASHFARLFKEWEIY